MGDYDRHFEAARHAVGVAAEVCRRVQQDLEHLRAITKDDRSPVTVADFASQAVVALLLTDALGPVRLVAEEGSSSLREPAHASHLDATAHAVGSVIPGVTPDRILAAIDLGAADPSPDGFWTLDPVDGTKGFLRGQQYAVSLAYLVDYRPVVGLLACPNLPVDPAAPLDTGLPRGCIFGATAGQGTRVWTRDEPNIGLPVRRQASDDLPSITVCSSVEESHTNAGLVDRVVSGAAPKARSLRLDSQCKYAVVARGQADLYLRLPTSAAYVERIWDHAAGALVATEAGCVVTDALGRALDFSHGRGLERNRGIVCAPPEVHARVVGAARTAGVA